MTEDDQGDRSTRHIQARRLAEEALAEQRAGHTDLADRLIGQAQRISAEAVIQVLEEHEGDAPTVAKSDTVRPDGSAPTRR